MSDSESSIRTVKKTPQNVRFRETVQAFCIGTSLKQRVHKTESTIFLQLFSRVLIHLRIKLQQMKYVTEDTHYSSMEIKKSHVFLALICMKTQDKSRHLRNQNKERLVATAFQAELSFQVLEEVSEKSKFQYLYKYQERYL